MKFIIIIIIIFKPYHSWSKVITSFEEGVRICNYCSGLCEQTEDIVVGLKSQLLSVSVSSDPAPARQHCIVGIVCQLRTMYCTVLAFHTVQEVRSLSKHDVDCLYSSYNCPPPRSYFQQLDRFHIYKKRHCPYEISYFISYQWFQTFNNHVRSTSLKYRFEIFSLWLVDNPVMPDLLSH